MEDRPGKGSEESLVPIPKLLNRLVDNQKTDPQLKGLESADFSGPASIFDFYKNNPRFRKAYRLSQGDFSLPLSREDHHRAQKDLTGRTFEDIAFLFLTKAQAGAGGVTLSPERTQRLWHRLYPESPVFYSDDGNFTKVHLPDGLLIKEDEETGAKNIESVTEYSIRVRTSFQDVYSDKSESFERDRNRFPSLFAHTKKVIVLPRGIDVDTSAFRGEVEVVTLPFDSKDYGHFIRDLYFNFRPGEKEPTLSEIQQIAMSRKTGVEGTIATQLRGLVPALNLGQVAKGE